MKGPNFYRRNLPHLHYDTGRYFITYRLNDSIPVHLLQELREEYRRDIKKSNDPDETKRRLFQKYDNLLDNNKFNKIDLTIPEIASVIKTTLHYPDKKDYNLICYCIMPNHVHLAFELLQKNKGIIKIMHSIKRISSLEINKRLSQKGTIWQSESYDRLIRDDKEMYFTIGYIVNNPVAAGLVRASEEWPHTYFDKSVWGS